MTCGCTCGAAGSGFDLEVVRRAPVPQPAQRRIGQEDVHRQVGREEKSQRHCRSRPRAGRCAVLLDAAARPAAPRRPAAPAAGPTVELSSSVARLSRSVSSSGVSSLRPATVSYCCACAIALRIRFTTTCVAPRVARGQRARAARRTASSTCSAMRACATARPCRRPSGRGAAASSAWFAPANHFASCSVLADPGQLHFEHRRVRLARGEEVVVAVAGGEVGIRRHRVQHLHRHVEAVVEVDHRQRHGSAGERVLQRLAQSPRWTAACGSTGSSGDPMRQQRARPSAAGARPSASSGAPCTVSVEVPLDRCRPAVRFAMVSWRRSISGR